MADSQQWDEVLQTLGKSKDTAPPLETPAETRFEPLPRVETAIALLRGRAHEKLGSREEAAPCYGDALRLDPLCVEAFSRLSQQAMCTPSAGMERAREVSVNVVDSIFACSAEQNLLKELVWNNVAKADASIMRAYYSARSSKVGGMQKRSSSWA